MGCPLGIKGAEIARKMNVKPFGVSKLAGRQPKDPLDEEIESRLFDSRRPKNRQEVYCQYFNNVPIISLFSFFRWRARAGRLS
jgi:hypothetical protein